MWAGNKNIPTSIYRTRSNDSTLSGYFCIGFIDFFLKGKSLTILIHSLLTNIKRIIK